MKGLWTVSLYLLACQGHRTQETARALPEVVLTDASLVEATVADDLAIDPTAPWDSGDTAMAHTPDTISVAPPPVASAPIAEPVIEQGAKCGKRFGSCDVNGGWRCNTKIGRCERGGPVVVDSPVVAPTQPESTVERGSRCGKKGRKACDETLDWHCNHETGYCERALPEQVAGRGARCGKRFGGCSDGWRCEDGFCVQFAAEPSIYRVNDNQSPSRPVRVEPCKQAVERCRSLMAAGDAGRGFDSAYVTAENSCGLLVDAMRDYENGLRNNARYGMDVDYASPRDGVCNLVLDILDRLKM